MYLCRWPLCTSIETKNIPQYQYSSIYTPDDTHIVVLCPGVKHEVFGLHAGDIYMNFKLIGSLLEILDVFGSILLIFVLFLYMQDINNIDHLQKYIRILYKYYPQYYLFNKFGRHRISIIYIFILFNVSIQGSFESSSFYKNYLEAIRNSKKKSSTYSADADNL